MILLNDDNEDNVPDVQKRLYESIHELWIRVPEKAPEVMPEPHGSDKAE